MTGETEVTSSSVTGRDGGEPLRWDAASAISSQLRTEFKGFAIQTEFWSKWRRNRDSSAPRSLEHLLKQVEKGTQVRHSGRDRVLAELKLHRDTTPDADLRSALAWLCNAQSRMVNNPTTAHAREVLIAADAVKQVLARGAGTPG